MDAVEWMRAVVQTLWIAAHLHRGRVQRGVAGRLSISVSPSTGLLHPRSRSRASTSAGDLYAASTRLIFRGVYF